MTLTVRLRYGGQGELLQASFDRSVIKSASRLTYHQVEDALVKKDQKVRRALKGVMPQLESMGELAHLLKARREANGNLDFDLPEPELVLDMEGGITHILRSERLFSQGIIEEFMIAANEAVARFIAEQETPPHIPRPRTAGAGEAERFRAIAANPGGPVQDRFPGQASPPVYIEKCAGERA